MADLLLLALFAGLYSVPMYALIQMRSQPSHRSRIIAANNILNALFIVAAALLAILLLKAGATIPDLFLVTGLMNAVVAFYIFRLVPEFLMRFLAWILINSVYRVRATGLEHVPETGPCVVACNHVSYVDAVAVAGCVVRPVRFVMDYRIFEIPGLKFLFRTMGAIPIATAREDPALKERALAEAAAVLERGEVLGIFPEGALTPDGELGVFRRGLNEILARSPAPVIPMALRGLWGSLFSRAGEGAKVKRVRGVFSRIALVVGPPIAASDATPERLQETIAALRGKSR
jgi:1-acyl-sn-glycerol-3-phosphate acyltransferase